MKPFSERVDMHNNNIKENIIINEEDKSNFENTNKALLNVQADLLLNKKVVKVSNSLIKNNSVQLKNNIIVNDETFNINKNEWIRNRLKIDTNMQERKIIYRLETENENNSSNSIDVLSAYKDNGFYVIFKYINEKNNYDKEIKAKIKWNMFSNHFKIFDRNDNIIEEIIYNFNFKGWNGPTKLQILLPTSKPNIINGIGVNNSKLYMHKMENKQPEYNSIYKCYVLNFIKRKVIPNEKNMQIVYSDLKEDKSNILLQFAQTEKNEYILDYKYPFNNITALALAMTNLSSRMFCQ
jgi:hypothetical protein